MQSIELVSEHACHGGFQAFYRHDSRVIGLPMRFSVFRPPQAKPGSGPALIYLAGLTCTEETFAMKAGAQRIAAELGMLLISPDTSPRDTGIKDEAADWEFGSGAGFYVNATREPWTKFFRMEDYIVHELREIVINYFHVAPRRLGIFGHSMGGHGALILALRHQDVFRSVSALAPIAAPSQCAWGRKAFAGYFGDDEETWRAHDASALMRRSRRPFPEGILVDQGLGDKFLQSQLLLEEFEEACKVADQPLELRRHAGYDHGYYFVSSFVQDHLRFHAERLCASCSPHG